MPGPNDAVTKLLMEKYYLPFEVADAYSYKIQSGEEGERGVRLQEEAMSNLAKSTLAEYADLTDFVKEGSIKDPLYPDPNLKPLDQYSRNYQARVGASRQNTFKKAEAAKDEQDARLLDLTAEEMNRLGNMFGWAEDVNTMPVGGGGYMTNYDPPGDFSKAPKRTETTMVLPANLQLGPQISSQAIEGAKQFAQKQLSQEKQPSKEDVALSRLQRALDFRRHVLGQ